MLRRFVVEQRGSTLPVLTAVLMIATVGAAVAAGQKKVQPKPDLKFGEIHREVLTVFGIG
jgi:hypothetical protein